MPETEKDKYSQLTAENAALLAQARKFQRELLEMRAELAAASITGIRSIPTARALLERAEAAEDRCLALERAVKAKDAALRDGIDYILGGHSIACMNVPEGSEPCDKCWPCKRLKARRVMVAALSAAPQSAGEAKCHCDAEADLADRPGARCADCVCQQPAPNPSAARVKLEPKYCSVRGPGNWCREGTWGDSVCQFCGDDMKPAASREAGA